MKFNRSAIVVNEGCSKISYHSYVVSAYRLVSILCTLLLSSSLYANWQEPHQLWQDAESALQNNNFAAAEELLLKLLEDQYEDAALLSSLAICSERQGRIPEALWYYERALLDQPGYSHAINGRNRLQKSLAPDQLPEEISPLQQLQQQLFLWPSNKFWPILSLVCIWLGGLVLMVSHRRQSLRWMITGLAILFLSAIALLVGISVKNRMENQLQGIVTGRQPINMYISADQQSPVITALSPGQYFRLSGELNGWQKITLPNGQFGWVKAEGWQAW